MKCPACVAKGQRSTLHEQRLKEPPEGGEVERFWDEDEIRHVHVHTVIRIVVTCSRGHAYQQRIQELCPHKACAWNQQETVLARDRPIGGSATGKGP